LTDLLFLLESVYIKSYFLKNINFEDMRDKDKTLAKPFSQLLLPHFPLPAFLLCAVFFPRRDYFLRLARLLHCLFRNESILTFGAEDEKNRDLREGRHREVHHYPEHRGRPGGNGK
jgi:hypothetical protein